MIAEKASVCFCHQHKSFNFNQIFLKLADKVDMNQILTKLKKKKKKKWPDRIFRVTPNFDRDMDILRLLSSRLMNTIDIYHGFNVLYARGCFTIPSLTAKLNGV